MYNDKLKKIVKNTLDSQNIEIMVDNPFKTIQDFRNNFDVISGNKGIIHTPYKDIVANIVYAWRHFTQNTYNKDRSNIKGGFFLTFKNPLFVVEQMREEKRSIYFYKPFYSNNEILQNLFGIGTDSNAHIKFKTYYLDNRNTRIESLLNDKNIKIKYLKS